MSPRPLRAARAALAATLALALAACQPRPEVAGSWESWSPGGQRTTLVFRAGGTGVRFARGEAREFRYTVDYERDPIAIDLRVRAPGGGEQREAGVLQFLDARRMRMRIAADGQPRPAGFSRAEQGTLFTRRAAR